MTACAFSKQFHRKKKEKNGEKADADKSGNSCGDVGLRHLPTKVMAVERNFLILCVSSRVAAPAEKVATRTDRNVKNCR